MGSNEAEKLDTRHEFQLCGLLVGMLDRKFQKVGVNIISEFVPGQIGVFLMNWRERYAESVLKTCSLY